MYGSLVFHDASLLDAFHKLIQLHVLFWQLEALHGTLFAPVVMPSTFPLLVPLDAADEPFQLRPSVSLWTVIMTPPISLVRCVSVLSLSITFHLSNVWVENNVMILTAEFSHFFHRELTCSRSASGRESTSDLTICSGKMSESVL